MDIATSLNYNDKDLLDWFYSVIFFLTKMSVLSFFFSGICLWDFSYLFIFGCLFIFDIYQTFTGVVRSISNSFLKYFFFFIIFKFDRPSFSRSNALRIVIIVLEKLSFASYYVKLGVFK